MNFFFLKLIIWNIDIHTCLLDSTFLCPHLFFNKKKIQDPCIHDFFFLSKVNNMTYWHPHLHFGQHISVSTLALRQHLLNNDKQKKSVKKKRDLLSIYFVHIYHLRTFNAFFSLKCQNSASDLIQCYCAKCVCLSAYECLQH